jgi:hypothetical protein
MNYQIAIIKNLTIRMKLISQIYQTKEQETLQEISTIITIKINYRYLISKTMQL